MRKGFSLIELLIYVGILGVTSTLLIGILTTSTRVQVHEVSLAEVGNQANFVLQTIQRLVRESSLVEEANQGDNLDTSGVEVSYLKLRMKDDAKDPTCVSLLSDGVIYVTQGSAGIAGNCKEALATNAIITDKVTTPTGDPAGLSFNLVQNAPGKDLVEVGLTLDFANAPPGGQYSKTLSTAIGRVSAATFDSDLIPSTADTRDIGQGIARWQDLFVNNIDVSGTISQPGNYNGGNRGFMMIGAPALTSCDIVCQTHGLTCSDVFRPTPVTNAGMGSPQVFCNTTAQRRLCPCE